MERLKQRADFLAAAKGARVPAGPFMLQVRKRGDAARQADSRLRPRARRALSTLRPPFVARRARKPWRRLRTSLLG